MRAPIRHLALSALATLLLSLPGQGALAQSYRVDQARDGKFFIINGVGFEARQICRLVKTGDEVTFLTGSADGRCLFATFLDLSSGTKCEVWCQQPLREMP